MTTQHTSSDYNPFDRLITARNKRVVDVLKMAYCKHVLDDDTIGTDVVTGTVG